MVHALILATGRGCRSSAEAEAPPRALLPVEGRPVLARVLAAFRQSREVEEVVVVGPGSLAETVGPPGGVRWVEAAETLPQSVRAGLRGLGLSTPVVIAPADLALLSTEMVDALVGAMPRGVDVAYPLIGLEVFEKAFPTLPAVPLRFAEGSFVGARLAVAKPQAVVMNYGLLQRACKSRRPVADAIGLLGPWTSLLNRMRLLSTRTIAARATQLLGAPCAALPGMAPELAFTLDSTEHLRLVREGAREAT